MQGIYPEVGSKGIIAVAEPYRKIFSDRVIYECTAIESIHGLVAQGYAPFDLFYLPYGIKGDVYEEDLLANAYVVSFRSSDGRIDKIPNRFIDSLPNPDGVVYQSTSIGAVLSIIPEYLDLTPIEQEIEQLLMKRLGVAANVKTVISGPNVMLTHEQHNAVKVVRHDASTNKFTYLLESEENKIYNERLKRYCDLMEATLEKLNQDKLELEKNIVELKSQIPSN